MAAQQRVTSRTYMKVSWLLAATFLKRFPYSEESLSPETNYCLRVTEGVTGFPRAASWLVSLSKLRWRRLA